MWNDLAIIDTRAEITFPVSGLTITRAHFNAITEDAMVKINDLPIFNPQGNTLDSFLDNSLQDSSLFGHAFVNKRPFLKQDPLPMVFGIEDALNKIGDGMTVEIFKERLLLDNTLLLHQHLPPLSQVDKDYAPFVMVITGDKVVSALMLNANINVSVPVNLSNQVLSLLGFVDKHPLNVLVDSDVPSIFLGFINMIPSSSFEIILFGFFIHRNEEVELHGLFNTQPITMVSTMQVKRLVHKRDCTTALVMLREAEDDTEVHKFSDIAASLTELTKWDKLQWSSEAEKSLNDLKQALTTTPVLAIADPTQPFDVMTDASDRTSGGVLMQNDRVIAFDSHKFSTIQMRYPVYDKEFLAIVHAYRTWKHYLLGAVSIVRTDHQSLT
ncbi:hypothetical protein L7F22_045311 [Adiantum nelumboides]|nr:hypothetical protein [Adiantum nelumboides]